MFALGRDFPLRKEKNKSSECQKFIFIGTKGGTERFAAQSASCGQLGFTEAGMDAWRATPTLRPESRLTAFSGGATVAWNMCTNRGGSS